MNVVTTTRRDILEIQQLLIDSVFESLSVKVKTESIPPIPVIFVSQHKTHFLKIMPMKGGRMRLIRMQKLGDKKFSEYVSIAPSGPDRFRSLISLSVFHLNRMNK